MILFGTKIDVNDFGFIFYFRVGLIWIGFFSVTMANGLMGNYSKTFGMSFINDDHFYAKVAVFLNILNGCCRIVWGLNYDRYERLKTFFPPKCLFCIPDLGLKCASC